MGESPHGMGQLVCLTHMLTLCIALTWYSADYMQGTRMSFRSKEDAIAFAEQQGEHLHFN